MDSRMAEQKQSWKNEIFKSSCLGPRNLRSFFVGCSRVALGAVENGRDQGVSLQPREKNLACLMHLVVHDLLAHLVLDLLERGRPGGATVLDQHDVQAAWALENRADLVQRQAVQRLVDRLDRIAAG